MNNKGKLGLTILGAAGIFGVLGDGLLRSTPWGLNLLLWMSVLVAALLLLAPWRPAMLSRGGVWLFVPLSVFSVAFVWRDSPVLKALSMLAILISLALLLLRAQGGRVQVSGFVEYATAGALAALNVMAGALSLALTHIPWSDFLNRQASRRPLALVRGVALALPPLLLFGGLLVAGDPVFAVVVHRTLFPDFSVVVNVLTHCTLIGVFAWVVAGYLRGVLIGDERERLARLNLPTPRLGATEVSVVLVLLDTLFLFFVLIQIRYLFGGAPLVGIKPGLTYAEYARQGFFELVAVATLSLPLLLGIHWVLRKEKEGDERAFRFLALVQVALLFVIMVSAIERMVLYQREYGQTELRLYTSAFMGWLGLVFLWFMLTVLRGRRQHFVFGALLAGFAVLTALYILNPDSIIARVNLARAAAGQSFDSSYAASLSADAVPVLIAGLSSLEPGDRSTLARELLRRRQSSRSEDWRTWSVSRSRAERWTESYLPVLAAFAEGQTTR